MAAVLTETFGHALLEKVMRRSFVLCGCHALGGNSVATSDGSLRHPPEADVKPPVCGRSGDTDDVPARRPCLGRSRLNPPPGAAAAIGGRKLAVDPAAPDPPIRPHPAAARTGPVSQSAASLEVAVPIAGTTVVIAVTVAGGGALGNPGRAGPRRRRRGASAWRGRR